MQAIQNPIFYFILIGISSLKVSTKLIHFFSDDSDTEEAPEIKMSEKKPSREQICRDNLDQGMKVIFDYIKENVDSANNSPSIIMSLYDDVLKVIYQWGIDNCLDSALKAVTLFWTTSFNNSFSLFQLLKLLNFCN